MNRITMETLDALASHLGHVTGQVFEIRNANGQVGLDLGPDSRKNVTFLMSKRELHTAMGFMLKGAYAMRGDI